MTENKYPLQADKDARGIFCKRVLCIGKNADLEVGILWCSGEGNDVSDVLHAGDK